MSLSNFQAGKRYIFKPTCVLITKLSQSDSRTNDEEQTKFQSLSADDILYVVADDYERVKTIGEELASDIGRNVLILLRDNYLTASEIAKKYNLSRQLVAYHLGRLEKVGLVEVKEIDTSEKGKEMKRYRVPKMALLIVLPDVLENKEKTVIQLKRIATQNFMRKLLMSIGLFLGTLGIMFGVGQLLYHETPQTKESVPVATYGSVEILIALIVAVTLILIVSWSYFKRRH